MCGICGFVKFNNGVSSEDNIILRRMNSKLFHRGPDAQDVLLFDNVGFGFSRLSIIGVENGMQPIANEDGSILVICNGEIFNYIELRQELKSRGHRFQTSSDVEVLVHLYEEFGTGFLNKLTGQFAFALYDKTRKTLFCARDHMGIAPFFYTVAGNTFIFGSEIKAIIEHPLVVREIDMVGLDQVFTFAGLISPRTMFKGVRSLENGHYLTVDPKGEVSDVEYWDLIYPEGEMPMNGKPESFYIDRLEELFHRSVDLRLRTDVPFGLYLSGGLDSSLIAMKVNQLIPQNRKEAFSIDFIDSQLSESVYQKMVATESNSAINQKIFFYDDISHRLKKAVYHCECPLKESYNTASLSLSESVRSKGIKVILSGEGADEFFAGYVGYRFDKIRAMSPVGNAPGAAEQKLRRRLWGDGSFFYERNYLEFDAVKRSLYSDDVSHAFEEINCLNHFVVDETKLRNRNTMNKRSYIDYKLRLVDHLVSDHGDRMALANSVEVRYPFLDKDLVEFSTTIPADLKLNDLTEKYILKKLAARNSVPRAVVEREKFGFVAPGSPYLIQKGTEYVNDILSYDRISRQGYFNPEKVQELRKTYQQNGFKINVPFESDLLMTVITLGILLEEYF